MHTRHCPRGGRLPAILVLLSCVLVGRAGRAAAPDEVETATAIANVQKTCARLDAEATQAVSKALAENFPALAKAALAKNRGGARCADPKNPHGTWAIAATQAVIDDQYPRRNEEPNSALVLTGKLAFVDPHGALFQANDIAKQVCVAVWSTASGPYDGAWDRCHGTRGDWLKGTTPVLANVDWTGDGRPELALDDQSWPQPYEYGYHPDLQTLGLRLYAFDGKVIAPYVLPLAVPFAPTSLRDIDHDGLADLLDGKRWSRGELDGEHVESLAIVAHALGNGKFALDDTATRSYYADVCKDAHAPWNAAPAIKEKTPELVAISTGEVVARRLACACELGMDITRVRAALEHELEAAGMKDAEARAAYPLEAEWEGCDRLPPKGSPKP